MNASRRTTAMLAAALLVLLLRYDSARPADEKPAADPVAPWGLVSDPHAGLQLAAAAEYIKDEDWKNALRLLQHLLDGKQDTLGRLAKPGGKSVRYVSVRAQAEQLLAAMPKAGREVYQRTYGPRAAELLKQARQTKDAELLARIARRYRYTDAGSDAWYERGQGRKLPEVSKRQTLDWPIYRGNAERSAQGVGGAPFLAPIWRSSMMHDDPKQKAAPSEHLKRTADYLKGHNQPIVSAFSPITVTVTRGDKKVPLLIYKNYWGVVARDLKSGEIVWESPSQWSLERMLRTHAEPKKQTAMTTWLDYYQNQHPQIIFENSTVGTLSTDGQFVYVVEDLAVPPPQMVNANMAFPGGMNNNPGYRAEIQDAIGHSRLQAYELRVNGKLTWELGNPEEKGPLSGCYFLGPPLPLDGLLYLLVEKQQELSLVCLDPAANGKLLSIQSLAHLPNPLQNEPERRTQAAHLAYRDGIFVCPSNAGILLGVDARENRLAWVYPYREKSEQPPQRFDRFGRRRGFIVGPDGRPIQPTQNHNQWKASAPVIADGKVVLAPPDAASLHCLNLRDGSLLWSRKKKDEEVYLGGVFDGKVLIVGKKTVQARNLASGAALWTLETGMPSGQGVASKAVYYLPLKEAIASKQPEICAIDVHKGQIVARLRMRPRTVGDNYDVPGNLLFGADEVISLTPWEVVVYPQIQVQIARITEALARNSNDPIGLTERAALRRDNGDLPGAVDDLRNALKNKPDRATRQRARALLFDLLTRHFQRDLRDADKHLKEYEELCKVDGDAAEQGRRRVLYLLLVARLRESQGRLTDALKAYLDLGALGPGDELVSVPDDPLVKVRRDVWVRGRIAELLKKATPEQRKQLDEEMKRRLKDAQSGKDVQGLRDFIALYGDSNAAGREASLLLAERLIEKHEYLEAELRLQTVQRQRDEPIRAAQALKMLGRLMTAQGLLPDAVYYYRILRRDFGKTGADVWDALHTDKRFLTILDESDPFATGKLKAKAESSTFSDQMPGHGQFFQFEHRGEKLPFFRQHIVGLSFTNHEFKLLDRKTHDDVGAPKEIWRKKLMPTLFQLLSNQVLGRAAAVNNFNPNPNSNNFHEARFPYRTIGHLIVLPVGHLVYGIDPVNRRVLWEVNLTAGGSGPVAVNPANPAQHPPLVDPRDGSVLMTYTDGWAQRLGQVGSVEGQTVFVQTREGLAALDPLTGRTLWSRSDVNSRNYHFADENYVFVVELNNENQPHVGRVFRAADGITVSVPDFAALFGKRLQVVGGHILLTETGPASEVALRLFDPLTGQDVWKQNYAARSIVTHSEAPHLAGVVEPDGKVHVVDLRTRKEVMAGKIEKPSEMLRNVQVIHLLADRRRFYFACQGPMEANNVNRFSVGLTSNLMTHLGMRTLPVNGRICAFGRDDGSYEWVAPVKNQFLLLDQFAELPVLLLTARHQELKNMGVGQQWAFVASAMSIEKRSGRVLFDEPDLKTPQTANFHGVSVDVRAGTIDFLSSRLKITHSLAGGKPPGAK